MTQMQLRTAMLLPAMKWLKGIPRHLSKQAQICSLTPIYHSTRRAHETTLNHVTPLHHVTTKWLQTATWLRKQESCSRFPVPELSSLPEDLQNRVGEIAEKSGFTPNVFSGMSYRPDELRAFMNYYDIVMEERGNLTKADKEMIVVATSAENRCLYCIIAHGALQRIFSRNPYLADQLAANWSTAELDDRQRAILEFAVDLCHCRPVSQERLDALEHQGLTQEDVWDIGAVVALFALSNRMAYLMNLKPNPEFYLMGRVKKEKK